MNRSTQILGVILTTAALLSGCDGTAQNGPQNNSKILNERVIEGGASINIIAEIWVDNWFKLAVNGQPLIEDSVPYNTERSFNAERVTFSADLPMVLAFEVRDFKENDTGLEYIGSGRQQMGDGGMIAQLRNVATGKTIGVTDKTMRCLVVHQAPLDRACAEEANPVAGEGVCLFKETAIPENWTAPAFDDSNWPLAVEHSADEVRPKDGYNAITWDPSAKLVWSEDLVKDNTLLCRMKITK